MIALYAALRLVWRPLTLLLLGMVWFVVAFVLQVIPDVSEVAPVLRALWLGTATPAMVTALWVVLAIAPAGIGLIVAMNRLDLQHTTLSWHLPDLRRRLLTGTVACALALGVAAAALMARNAPAALSLAAFSLACYAFLAPGFCFDVAVSRPARALLAVPLIAVVGWPGSTLELAHQYPWLVTTLGLALAGLQLPAITSERTARRRPFRWSALHRSGSRARYWGNRTVRRLEWRRSLANERLLPWLRAAMYESESRYPLAHLRTAALTVLTARLIDVPQVVPVFAGTILMTADLQLHMRIAYPLSRARRAQLAYAGTVVDAVTYFLFLGALLYATSLVPLPRLPSVDWTSSPAIEWVLMWGCSLALAPIAQWSRISRPDEDTSRLRGTRMAAYLVRLLAYALVVILVAGAIYEPARGAGDLARAVLAIGVIAALAQVTHAVLVHVHYTSGDLVRTSGAR